MIGRAFCPCHITGFFEIRDRAENVLERGSRGAGLCVSRGVQTAACANPGNRLSIEIFLNGKKAKAAVTEYVARKLVGKIPANVVVRSELELPLSQGFGISGAGALSAALALNSALQLNKTYSELVGIAHEAEILNRTGLGDVMAQATGGVTIRRREGTLPFGFVDNIPTEPFEILLCIVGDELRTKSVLISPGKTKKINRYGHGCVSKLLEEPTVENLFRLSYDFARKTGLMDKKVAGVVDAVWAAGGMASMSMLGNSVFATGNLREVERVLSEYGQVFDCLVETRKAFVV